MKTKHFKPHFSLKRTFFEKKKFLREKILQKKFVSFFQKKQINKKYKLFFKKKGNLWNPLYWCEPFEKKKNLCKKKTETIRKKLTEKEKQHLKKKTFEKEKFQEKKKRGRKNTP